VKADEVFTHVGNVLIFENSIVQTGLGLSTVLSQIAQQNFISALFIFLVM
jgi:hypothetical protein